jgi:TonB family protein
MINRTAFLMFLILGFGLTTVSAQTATSNAPKTISGGVLNGKAQILTKPAFPAAARAVNASGAVNVQVTIDENGDVISASAVSGHPLLRQASEQAALSSKFAPTLLQGQPVKVTGVIVYNFVSPMTVTQIGYELSLAERSQTLKRFQVNSIAGSFPNEWTEEKEALQNLEAHLKAKPAAEKNSPVTPPAKVADAAPNPPNGKYQGNVIIGSIATRIGSVDDNSSLDSEGVAILRDLQSKLENRLSVKDNVLWSFKLGSVLGKIKAEIDSDEKTQANISELNQLGANAPSSISEASQNKIREMVESVQQTATDAERKEKLLLLVENLKNARTY